MINQLLKQVAQQVGMDFFISTLEEMNFKADKQPLPFIVLVPPTQHRIIKYQGAAIIVEYSFQLLFLKLLNNSSIDADVEVEMAPTMEAMLYKAIEFMLNFQQLEPYRKAQNTNIEFTSTDILDTFDTYVAGQSVNANLKLYLPWNYCEGVLNFVLTENKNNILTD
jgi:hypothetical protein